MNYTFKLHNTEPGAELPCHLGLVFSQGLLFADDGFGTYLSVPVPVACYQFTDVKDPK